MRRPIDIIFVKALVRAHTISASEATGAVVNTGASVSARTVMAVLDVGVVTAGSITPGGFDGSDDNFTTPVLNVGLPAAVLINAAGGSFFDLRAFRYYRFQATTIVTGPIIYGCYLVGLSAATPVTQAI